ncbi:MAG: hypothetical protein ACOZCL_03275 [Bacillota bacterium]
MLNSMKTTIFIISLTMLIAYFTATSGITMYVLNNTAPIVSFYIVSFITMIGYLFMLAVQAAVRIIYTNKKLKGTGVIAKLPVKTMRFVDKLVVYSFPVVLTLLPVFRKGVLDEYAIAAVICIIVLIIILEILFYLNRSTMNLYITNMGLAIKGIDLRLDTPLPSNYKNATGFYGFERLQSFMDLNDRLILHQSYDAGIIEIVADRDELNKIKSLLLSKQVVERKR